MSPINQKLDRVGHVKDIKTKIKELTDLAIRAKSPSSRSVYEMQIEESALELEKLESGQIMKWNDMQVPYRTALEKSRALLKNPVILWDSVDVYEKQKLFFFLFESKLAYTKNEGYRTGNLLSTTRLFEEFVNTNSQDVEMPRIALGCTCGAYLILRRVVFI